MVLYVTYELAEACRVGLLPEWTIFENETLVTEEATAFFVTM